MKFLLPLSILAVCAALPAQAQTPPDSPPHLDVSGVNLEPLYPAKALAAGIKKVFGDAASVQRCVLHYVERRIMWTAEETTWQRRCAA